MPELTIDSTSPIPLYYQICEQFRILIQTGKLKPGDKLPTEAELRDQFGISRMTVRQALSELVREGLIVRKRAKGTFVAQSRREVPLDLEGLRSFHEEAVKYGDRLTTRILEQQVIPAAGKVAKELQLPLGSKVTMLCRLRVVDGEPIAIETAHFPYDRFPLLGTMDLNNVSTYAVLDREYQCRPEEAIDSFTAGPPTAAEAKMLNIEPSCAVWHCERTAFDRSGCPIEFTEAAFRLDRFRFTTRRRRLDVAGNGQAERAEPARAA